MAIIAVEAVPAGSKPPAAVGVRISTGERGRFGAAAPLSTKTSSLRVRAIGLDFMPKLVKLVGPAWTLFEEQISPCFALPAAAAPSVCFQNFLSAGTFASVARHGCRSSSCSRLAERCLVSLIFSGSSSKWLFIRTQLSIESFF